LEELNKLAGSCYLWEATKYLEKRKAENVKKRKRSPSPANESHDNEESQPSRKRLRENTNPDAETESFVHRWVVTLATGIKNLVRVGKEDLIAAKDHS
jgi:hypothetical protein